MQPKEYVKNVLITEARDMTPLKERFSQEKNIRLLHGIIGLSSELSELQDLIESSVEIDPVHLKEEVGDQNWYMGVIIDTLGIDPCSVFLHAGKPLADQTDGIALKGQLTGLLGQLTFRVGNVADLVKKHIMYGKELKISAIEENLRWMDAILGAMLVGVGLSTAEARETNIAKLKFRYKEKFTEAAALERDLNTERAILEGKKDAVRS